MSGRPGTSQLHRISALRASSAVAAGTPRAKSPPPRVSAFHPAHVVASQSLEACTKSYRAPAQAYISRSIVAQVALAPALCGGGGAPTSWLVGFLADPLSDRVGRLLGPPSLYGAHTGPFSAGRCSTGIADGRRGTAECRCTRPVCWLRQRRVSDAVKWAQIGKKAVASIEQ